MKLPKEDALSVLLGLSDRIKNGELILIEVRSRLDSVRDYLSESDGIRHFDPSEDFWIEFHLVKK